MKIDAEAIKQSISIYDILGKYSIPVDRAGMVVCPFHGDKNASMKIYANTNTFHCFGCEADGDIFAFVQKMENCDFFKALEIVAGENFSRYERPEPPKSKNYVFDKSKIVKFVVNCHKNVGKTNYFGKRYLNRETIQRFRLGYDEKHNSVVIPYSRSLTYYQSRNIDTKKFYKPKTDVAGREPLFNQEVLQTDNVVFVVESPICAMSIMQCGFNALATCGTQGWKKIPQIPLHDDCYLILCFDNDVEGKKAEFDLFKTMFDRCFVGNIADECKDPNELLMKDAERLKRNLTKLENRIRERIK